MSTQAIWTELEAVERCKWNACFPIIRNFDEKKMNDDALEIYCE